MKSFEDAGAYSDSIPGLLPGHALFLELVLARASTWDQVHVCGVVGPGPGPELVALAERLPRTRFVCYEPSPVMRAACSRAVTAAGMAERVELLERPLEPSPTSTWDAGVSLFVGHLIPEVERPRYWRSLASHLLPGAPLLHAEMTIPDPHALGTWLAFSREQGLSQVALERLAGRFGGGFALLAPEQTERLALRSGLAHQCRLAQVLGTTLWLMRRSPVTPAGKSG